MRRRRAPAGDPGGRGFQPHEYKPEAYQMDLVNLLRWAEFWYENRGQPVPPPKVHRWEELRDTLREEYWWSEAEARWDALLQESGGKPGREV
jgi:hypothetical protein